MANARRFVGPGAPFGAVASGWQTRSLSYLGIPLQYQLFIPAAYSPGTATSAIIVSCHGSGERYNGSNLNVQTTVGLPAYATNHAATFAYPVVATQYYDDAHATAVGLPTTSPANTTAQCAIHMIGLAQTLAELNVDHKRIHLTGYSNGAYRAWEMAFGNPTTFASLTVAAGGIFPSTITNGATTDLTTALGTVQPVLNTIPIWQYHGDATDTIDPEAQDTTINSYYASRSANVTYLKMAGMDHQPSWDNVYGNSTTYDGGATSATWYNRLAAAHL